MSKKDLVLNRLFPESDPPRIALKKNKSLGNMLVRARLKKETPHTYPNDPQHLDIYKQCSVSANYTRDNIIGCRPHPIIITQLKNVHVYMHVFINTVPSSGKYGMNDHPQGNCMYICVIHWLCVPHQNKLKKPLT